MGFEVHTYYIKSTIVIEIVQFINSSTGKTGLISTTSILASQD
jgi:hypothetical protein